MLKLLMILEKQILIVIGTILQLLMKLKNQKCRV
jgi:hypothetical protein